MDDLDVEHAASWIAVHAAHARTVSARRTVGRGILRGLHDGGELLAMQHVAAIPLRAE